MSEAEERRKAERVSFTETPWLISIEWRLEEKLAFAPRVQPQNISLCGIKIHTNFKIPLFELVPIQLIDKLANEMPLQLQGKIVRVEEIDTGKKEKIYGLAIEFEELNPEQQEKLKRIC